MFTSTRFALALSVAVLCGSTVCAHGHRTYRSGYYNPTYSYWSGYYYPTYSYYSYSPIVYDVAVPIYTAPPAVACPAPQPPQVSIYAQPSPAPPSTYTEPPTSQPPKVNESRSHYRAASASERTSYKLSDSLCRVGYWNVTGRYVSLVIDGQSYSLPPGRSMTLTLPRQFAWQMDGGRTQVESVARDRPTMEIVIRK